MYLYTDGTEFTQDQKNYIHFYSFHPQTVCVACSLTYGTQKTTFKKIIEYNYTFCDCRRDIFSSGNMVLMKYCDLIIK